MLLLYAGRNYDFTPHSKLMQADEIDTIARLFVQHGVNKIRLTGGEPFVRKDASKIIRNLGKLPVQLTCTTNGIRIDDMLPEIIQSDFHSINISLDTLQRKNSLRLPVAITLTAFSEILICYYSTTSKPKSMLLP